ncbi:hypothetical protein RKLH11_3139 [Rhodobacteraceae bacterium KLH11]|nr:hypothetical protein RKLH11_3139 [Rhodobacteraceae bacterium KLH11]
MLRFEECVGDCVEFSSDSCDDGFVRFAGVTQSVALGIGQRIVRR